MGAPQPGPWEAMGREALRLEPLEWAEAGTLNCLFSCWAEPQSGQEGWSEVVRTRVSKVCAQGSQRYS